MSTEDDITERADALLVALGDTRDIVAAALSAKGIKGERRKWACCPVANYLKQSGLPVVMVDTTGILLDSPDIDAVWLDTPNAITDFIYHFDDGAWPELAEPVGSES